jgi:sigma-B regulation protein RsbU (phosphoserine phosphatase)
MRILAVEDDPVSRRILTATLERLGHQVTVAQDGQEAWTQIVAAPAEVVITDWMMPRLDGIELTRRIRAREGGRYTYIIMLTAMRGRTSYLDGMAAGADDFVTKPFDKDELRARLCVAVRVLGLQREVKQLEGLLPICTYCKRIRDEADAWSQVEEYVGRRTEAQFSHGICPDCYERHLKPQLESVQNDRFRSP